MTRNQVKELVSRMANQLDTACKRIVELEANNQLGLEHTAMREQINGTLKTVEWLKETMPYPFLPIDFNRITDVTIRYKFSWLYWI